MELNLPSYTERLYQLHRHVLSNCGPLISCSKPRKKAILTRFPTYWAKAPTLSAKKRRCATCCDFRVCFDCCRVRVAASAALYAYFNLVLGWSVCSHVNGAWHFGLGLPTRAAVTECGMVLKDAGGQGDFAGRFELCFTSMVWCIAVDQISISNGSMFLVPD